MNRDELFVALGSVAVAVAVAVLGIAFGLLHTLSSTDIYVLAAMGLITGLIGMSLFVSVWRSISKRQDQIKKREQEREQEREERAIQRDTTFIEVQREILSELKRLNARRGEGKNDRSKDN